VFLVQGPGPWCSTPGRPPCTSARNVKGSGPNGHSTSANAVAGTLVGTNLGYVNYTRTQFPVSLSQSFGLSFIPSDFRYAYGGIDQLFSCAYGKYLFGRTFAVRRADISFDFNIGYV